MFGFLMSVVGSLLVGMQITAIDDGAKLFAAIGVGLVYLGGYLVGKLDW